MANAVDDFGMDDSILLPRRPTATQTEPTAASAPTSNAAPSAAASAATESRFKTSSLQLAEIDTPIVIQTLDMGKAVYLWCGTGQPALTDMIAAVPAPSSIASGCQTAGAGTSATNGSIREPTATVLFGTLGTDKDEAESVAKLLSQRLGKMVYLCWRVPDDLPPLTKLEVQRAALQHCQAKWQC